MSITTIEPRIKVNGNGSKKGYSFNFHVEKDSDVIISFLEFGKTSITLSNNDFILTQTPNKEGRNVEFKTITPAVKDSITFTRKTPIINKVDFNERSQVTYYEVEYEFERVYNILQELSFKFKVLSSSKIPDPQNYVYGYPIVSSGKNGYELFPFRLDHATNVTDGSVLTVDTKANKILFSPPTAGSHNPPIPPPSKDLLQLVSVNGSYILSNPQEPLLATDKNVALVWNGVRFIKTDAHTLANPSIPKPTNKDQILETDTSSRPTWVNKPDVLPKATSAGQQLKSDKNLKARWVDSKDSVNTEMSNGIISGFDISRIDDTHIKISAGAYQIVDDTVGDNPKVTIKNYSGTPNFQIPIVGSSSFLYLDTTTTKLKVESSYVDNPRATLILLAEIEHTHNKKITRFSPEYTVINSTAYQLKQFFKQVSGNKAKFIRLTGKLQTSNQLEYTAGKFFGYGVNANNSKAIPNEIDLTAKSPAPFRWRTSKDVEGASLTTIDSTKIKIETTSGTIKPLNHNHWTQCLVWVTSDGELLIQYGFEDVNFRRKLLNISDFIKSIPKSELLKRNSAPVAVIRFLQGADFKRHEIIQLTDFNVGGSGSSGLGLPIVGTSDAGKTLTVSSVGNWVTTNYKIISLPPSLPTDVGKSVVVSNTGKFVLTKNKVYTMPTVTQADKDKLLLAGDAGNFVLSSFPMLKPDAKNKNLIIRSKGDGFIFDSEKDYLARTYLTSGVIKGFRPVEILSSGTSIKIPRGDVIFMDDKEGEPEHQTYKTIPANPQYDLMQISKNDATYIYVTRAGNILETYTEPHYVRGDKVLLFRVDHSDRKKIESVSYLFEIQNAIPNQIKEIFKRIGNKVEGLEIETEGKNSLKHSGGKFLGFNAGAGDSELEPHTKIMQASNPLPFEFRNVAGKDTATVTAFPAVPKVEKTKGTQTELTDGHVAYYPTWIFPFNRLVVQVATKEYTSAKLPSATDIALEMKPDSDAKNIGAFVGFIKWEKGKDFSNGNSFIHFNLLSGVASGSPSSLPTILKGDEGRVLQISNTGDAHWGVKIIPPSLGNNDTPAIFDTMGNIVAGSNDDDIIIPNAPQGDFFAVTRNGKIEALTNHTDYPRPGYWSNEGLGNIITEPFPQYGSSKGIQCISMTKNNAGAGEQQHIRIISLLSSIKKLDIPATIADPTRAGVDANDYPLIDDYNNIVTSLNGLFTDTKFLNYIKPKTKGEAILIGGFKKITGGGVYDKANWLNLYNGNSDFEIKLSAIDPINVNETRITNIPFTFISSTNWEISVSEERHKANVSATTNPSLDLISFNNALEDDITLEIVFDKCVVTESHASMQGGLSYSVDLITSSDKPITQETKFTHDINKSTTSTITIPLNVKTTIVGSGKKLYHRKGDAGNDSLYIGVMLNFNHSNTFGYRDSYFARTQRSGEMSIENKIKAITTGHINITRKSKGGSALARTDSRYEYKTLEEISNLQGNDIDNPIPKDFKGAFNGGAPKLKFGKITIMYSILFLSPPESFTEFNLKARGIVNSSYNVHNQPSIFLEEQTGKSKFTNRIEAVKMASKSTEIQIYHLNCTEEQFKKWKLVVYFHSNLPEVEFKKLCEHFGTGIWFVNDSNIEP